MLSETYTGKEFQAKWHYFTRISARPQFWVPTTVFDKEFVVGVNKAGLVKELQRLGWLLPPRPDGKAIHTRSVYGKRIYLYVFKKRENVREQGEQGEHPPSNPLSEP